MKSVIELDEKRICFGCMKQKETVDPVCPYCGFDPRTYRMRRYHLRPGLFLNGGKYILGRVIGEGGFGITYVAMELGMERCRTVAVKELFLPGLFQRDRTRAVLADTRQRVREYCEECRQNFQQEAALLHSLGDKDGVVDIYEYFEENGTAYIVMEYLDGEDLIDYLNRNGGRISSSRAFELLRPVMNSLYAINCVGVFHRDIAPKNIRHTAAGKMKIMDLGSAKYNFSNWQNRIRMVTPGYAPPEQYRLNYMLGPWMDVYAMSATFYRCITGQTPKSADQRKHDLDLILPRRIEPGIPPEVEQVILKGLALDVKKRYMDMHEFYRAIKNAVIRADE